MILHLILILHGLVNWEFRLRIGKYLCCLVKLPFKLQCVCVCAHAHVRAWSLDDKVPEHVLILRYVFCLIYVRVY